jgi:hypothetical protein
VFLLAIGDKHANPANMLGGAAARMHENRDAFEKLFAGEVLTSFRLYDYTVEHDGRDVTLRYWLAAFSEGTLCEEQHNVRLEFDQGRWMIVGLDDLPPM